VSPRAPEGNALGKLGFPCRVAGKTGIPFRGARRRAAPEPGELGVSVSRPRRKPRVSMFYGTLETRGFHRIPGAGELGVSTTLETAARVWGTAGFFHVAARTSPSPKSMKLGGFHFATRRTTDPIWRNLGFPFRGTAENFPKSGKPGVPMSRRDGNRNPNTGYLGVPLRGVTETAAQACGTSSFHVMARRKPPPEHAELRVSMPWRDGNRRPSPRSSGVSIFCGTKETAQFRGTRGFPGPATTETVASVRGTRVSMSRHDGEPPKSAELWGFCFVARGKPPSSVSLAVSISRPDENRAPGEGNLGFHVAARP